MSTYRLGMRSKLRLRGVHPDLVKVVQRAIEITTIDFTVLEGLRTVERQKQLVASGASKTLKSKHLIGEAVDIAPYVERRVSWHWPHYHILAPAMIKAARSVDQAITWGAVWDRDARELDTSDINGEIQAYMKRHEGPDFIDGPHWQLR